MTRPPRPRLHPITALRAVRNLMRDREDTHQVFLLIEALRGKTTLRQFARFRQTTRSPPAQRDEVRMEKSGVAFGRRKR